MPAGIKLNDRTGGVDPGSHTAGSMQQAAPCDA